jgi:hypothetical protein
LIAEELVERSAYYAFQNMKIDATEHVVAPEKAIGKNKALSHRNGHKLFLKFFNQICLKEVF